LPGVYIRDPPLLLCVFRSPISREVCCSRELSTLGYTSDLVPTSSCWPRFQASRFSRRRIVASGPAMAYVWTQLPIEPHPSERTTDACSRAVVRRFCAKLVRKWFPRTNPKRGFVHETNFCGPSQMYILSTFNSFPTFSSCFSSVCVVGLSLRHTCGARLNSVSVERCTQSGIASPTMQEYCRGAGRKRDAGTPSHPNATYGLQSCRPGRLYFLRVCSCGKLTRV